MDRLQPGNPNGRDSCDEAISDSSYIPAFSSPLPSAGASAAIGISQPPPRYARPVSLCSGDNYVVKDDHSGVAEALLKLQSKLNLLGHERALAEKDLNALTSELSSGVRQRSSRQPTSATVGRTSHRRQEPPQRADRAWPGEDDREGELRQRALQQADDPPRKEQHEQQLSRPRQLRGGTENEAVVRRAAAVGTVEALEPPSLEPSERRQPLSALHRRYADVLAPAESSGVNAQADLSAAEARCQRLDARLALMRRALHQASATHGSEALGPEGACTACEPSYWPPGLCGSEDRFDTIRGRRPVIKVPQCTNGKSVSSAVSISRRTQEIVPEAHMGATAAAKAEKKRSTGRRLRRAPTAPVLGSIPVAAEALLTHQPPAVLHIGNRSAKSRSNVGSSSVASAYELADATTAGNSRQSSKPWATFSLGQGRAGPGGPAASLRRLREEFSRLTTEHRELTLLIGDAIASGRPSVDLERELEHLMEKMELKGEEIACCVRSLSGSLPAEGSSVCSHDAAATIKRKKGPSSHSTTYSVKSSGNGSRKRAQSSTKARSNRTGTSRLRSKQRCPKAKVVLQSSSRRSGCIVSKQGVLEGPFRVSWA